MYKTAFLIGVVNIDITNTHTQRSRTHTHSQKYIYIKIQMRGDFINNVKLYYLLFLQIARHRKLYYQNVNKSMQIK